MFSAGSKWLGAISDILELEVSYEFVGDEFGGQELRYTVDLRSGYTHEECERVKNVTEHKLDGQVLDAETDTNPGEETIDHVYQCKNRQDICAIRNVNTGCEKMFQIRTQFDQRRLLQRWHRERKRGEDWLAFLACQLCHGRRRLVHG